VLYAKNMRGYGNLVILDHNDGLVTAYAHNKTILVKEGQTVTRGQKIAEMGNSDTDAVKLHFEVRQMGKPVDPVGMLPGR
jgi:lipoprotein NlpD